MLVGFGQVDRLPARAEVTLMAGVADYMHP
jgi:hypothetical protein